MSRSKKAASPQQQPHMETHVIISDLQLPFVDQPVLELVLRFIHELNPAGVILNGDIVDGYGLGKYPRDPQVTHTLGDEIREAQELMAVLQDIPAKVWVLGNHEARIANYIARCAPALGELPSVQFEAIFQVAKYGFSVVPYKDIYRLGKLVVTHGHHVRRQAGASVLAHIDQYGQSTCIGHTHRLAHVHQTDLNGVHVGLESGCLCRLDGLGYSPNPSWQQGFIVVDVDPATGWFSPQIIPMLRRDGKPCFFFEGNLIN